MPSGISHLTPEERRTRARIAALASWANTEDRTARTSHGTAAFMQRFYNQVDPDRVLSEKEREKRANFAMRSYMASLAYKRMRNKRKRAS